METQQKLFREDQENIKVALASIPEPPPKKLGESVPEQLISFLQDEKAVQLIKERNEFGMEKYGQPLMSKDGRNTIEDARQELGDLMQYCYKARINGEDLSEIVSLLPSLLKILE